MRVRIAPTVLAAALIPVPVGGASAATAEPVEDLAPVSGTTLAGDGDGGLWGLAGLAGLERRTDADHDKRSVGTIR